MSRPKKTPAQWRKEAARTRRELQKLSDAVKVHLADFDRIVMSRSNDNTRKLLKVIHLKGSLELATDEARFHGLDIPWPYQD